MRLEPEAAAAGFHLSVHDTLASTNTEALALARRGERGRTFPVLMQLALF